MVKGKTAGIDRVLVLPFLMSLIMTSLPLTLGFLDRSAGFIEAGDLDSEAIERNLFVLIGWGATYVCALFVVMLRAKVTMRAWLREPWLIMLTLLVLVSSAWDLFPWRSLVTGASFVMGIIIAMLAAPVYAQRPLLLIKMVFIVIGVSQIINYCIVVVFPDWGLDVDGRWTGWQGNANALGREALIAIWASLVLILFGFQSRKWVILALMILVVAILNLVGSNSVTAILVATLVVMMLVMHRRRIGLLWLSLFMPALGGLIALLILIVGADAIATLVGRDATGTGRLFAWQLAMDNIPEHLLLGHGFADTRYYIFGAGVSSTNFHNSYIELSFRVGLIGLCIYLLIIMRSLYAGLKSSNSRRYGYLFISFIICFSVIGLSESVITAPRSQMFLLFWVCTAVLLSKSQESPRVQRLLRGSVDMGK